jgi:hypothetical protein
MPLTCSHPAAILPFKRFTRLNFVALVIGSVSPDIGYFIGQRHLAKLAHYPGGTILICLPTGLILLALFYLVRRDLTYILPSPHRDHLMPLADRKPTWNAQFILIAALSILIGAWTHIVWDQFTHDGSFVSRHFSPLRFVLFHIRGVEVPVAYLLQYLSTIVGGGILAWFYWKWLRSQPRIPNTESDTWRYVLIFSLALVSLAAGVTIGVHLSDRIRDSETFREYVYTTGVSAVSVFTFLIVISAILCYRRKLGNTGL